MKNYTLNKLIILTSFLSIVIFPLSSFAQEENETPAEVTSLEQLILKVQEEALYDTEENRQRIAKFVAEKDTQQAILNKTLTDLKVQEDRAVVLEKEFDENDVKLSELEDLKAERLGAFGELFGVVRGTASEMGAQIKESIISGELTGRHQTLTDLAKSKKLPSNEELELLWYHLLEEMKAQGEVKHFTGTIVDTDGSFSEEEVIRVGPWTAFDRRGNFLGYLPDDERYRVLGRQPQARFLDLGDNVVDGDAGQWRRRVVVTGGSSAFSRCVEQSTAALAAAHNSVAGFTNGLEPVERASFAGDSFLRGYGSAGSFNSASEPLAEWTPGSGSGFGSEL